MKNIIFIVLIILLLPGCFRKDRMEAITVLTNLAQERAEQEKIIKLEKEKFGLLVEAVENSIIEKGLSEQDVLRQYGKPILIKQSDIPGIDKVWIFAEPLNYSGAKKVYLYFNEGKKLVLWEIKR